MQTAPLRIVWTALTCNLDGTDIYLGLAASQDDMVAYMVGAERLAAFPFQHIAIASGAPEQVPLRVYAVRDPRIVQITHLSNSGVEPGFQRVRLEFFLSPEVLAAPNGTARAVDAKLGAAAPAPDSSRSVFAFLLTIGLPVEMENDFYGTVVSDFLRKSWMSLPQLLKEIGCNDPADAAAGAGEHCH